MKNTITKFVFSTVILLGCVAASAQEKGDNKPKLDDSNKKKTAQDNVQSVPAPAPQLKQMERPAELAKPIIPGGEIKTADTRTTKPSTVKEDDMKPIIVPAKNITSTSPSTIAVDIPNTVRPTPLMSKNMPSTITTTAPVTKETKKPAPVVAEQQKQN